MKNKPITILKNKEKGSITLFMIISIIFFIIISISVYINICNKSAIQVAEISKIKSKYQATQEQMDEETIYEENLVIDETSTIKVVFVEKFSNGYSFENF